MKSAQKADVTIRAWEPETWYWGISPGDIPIAGHPQDIVIFDSVFYKCIANPCTISSPALNGPPEYCPPGSTAGNTFWTEISDPTGDLGNISGIGFFDYTTTQLNDQTLKLGQSGLEGLIYAKKDELNLNAVKGLVLSGGDVNEDESKVEVRGRQFIIATGLNPVIQSGTTSSPGLVLLNKTGDHVGDIYCKEFDRGLFYVPWIQDPVHPLDSTKRIRGGEQRLSVASNLDCSSAISLARTDLWAGSPPNFVSLDFHDANRFRILLNHDETPDGITICLVEPESGQTCTFMIHLAQDSHGYCPVVWKIKLKNDAGESDDMYPAKAGDVVNLGWKMRWVGGMAPDVATGAYTSNVISLSYEPGNFFLGTYSLELS